LKIKPGLDVAGLSPYLMVQPLAFHTPDAGKQGSTDLPEFPFGLGAHEGLRCSTQGQEEVLFGVRGARGTDGLHLRGSRAEHLHTAAVIAAIQACGLGGQEPAKEGRRSQPSGRRAAAGWQVAGGRRAARGVAGQGVEWPALATANRFSPLGN
jgi:hypothetical protein